jgi:putative membrane-bound dehydrogenase-like protein
MRTMLLSLACVAFLLTARPAAEPVKPAKTHDIRLNGHTFTLPVGFEIELVAGPPLVNRPITADFDEQGRLYVGDSSGSNEKVDVQIQKKPHRIVRVEDTDGDGKFDKSVVFADQMMFPEGTMWYAGSLYVAAPPSIWKLTDTDGDGIADQRVEWFQGKTCTGCANDLHGPYLGPDGWIYWCKGAFAQQTYERPGKTPFVTKASHIFRARPDGTSIEPVMTGGMDNPVDVVFMPNGERTFSTTFLQHPGGGLRDGLIHAVYGGVYGKDHDPIYEHPWTGPSLMPVLSHLGPAAPAGLHRYESDAFGPDYKDNLFTACFNLHKVTRHILMPKGATYESRDEDFVVSDNLDFHPTDVVEDADGSLLIVDTGGWYKLCCPTSQLVKPDVLGAIYRVRRAGARRIDDPRGMKLGWNVKDLTLVSRLNDPRPAVRWRATGALGAQGVEAVSALMTPPRRTERTLLHSVWALTQIDHPDARAAVHWYLYHDNEAIRQAALHSVGLWRDRDAMPLVITLLKRENLQTRRAAAEALGRIGDKAAVPALLEALAAPDVDRVLQHSLTYALIEIGDREATVKGLSHPNANVRRCSLIALDQMPEHKLEVAAIGKELSAADNALRETAWWIAGRHSEWADELAPVLQARLGDERLTPAERDELARQLGRFARSSAMQNFLAERLADGGENGRARQVVLHAMTYAALRETPETWAEKVTLILNDADAETLREAVATARSFRFKKPPEKLVAALARIGSNEKLPETLRLQALAAVPGGLTAVDPAGFEFLRSRLRPDQEVATRTLVADALSHAKLNSEQLLILIDNLKSAGPMELDRLLDAYASCSEDRVGTAVIAALKVAVSRSSLRAETLKPRLAKFGRPVQEAAESLYAQLNANTAEQKAKLEQLLTNLKDGDIRRGQIVFHSQKAACFTCHALGYRGGNVGPDLTRIGSIRTERDLLESIVFPSASLVRSYEPVLIATKDGKTINGLIRKETPEEITLATGVNQEVRIAREDIEAMKASSVSIMPAGLDQQLTPQELADLVAFLRACK